MGGAGVDTGKRRQVDRGRRAEQRPVNERDGLVATLTVSDSETHLARGINYEKYDSKAHAY